MSPADERREAEELEHEVRRSYKSPSEWRASYLRRVALELCAPYLPDYLIRMLAAVLGVERDASGVSVPDGIAKREEYLAAVHAEAKAQLAGGSQNAGRDNYVLSVSETARLAGVQRLTARAWRNSRPYRAAVAALVSGSYDSDQRSVTG